MAKHPGFDCLVLDVNLSGLSGIELGRRLVKEGRYALFICSAFLPKTDAGILDVIRRVPY